MAFPFGQLPTLRQFIDAAVALGCRELTIPGVSGPSGGTAYSRCLVSPTSNPVPLPNVPDDERLTPTIVGGLHRGLGIDTGFPCI
jgi:hypothetical protein